MHKRFVFILVLSLMLNFGVPLYENTYASEMPLKIDSVTALSSYGIETGNIEEGTYIGELHIKNNQSTEVSEGAKVIVALYDGERFADMAYADVDTVLQEETIVSNVKLKIKKTITNPIIKCFIWDSLESAKPIAAELIFRPVYKRIRNASDMGYINTKDATFISSAAAVNDYLFSVMKFDISNLAFESELSKTTLNIDIATNNAVSDTTTFRVDIISNGWNNNYLDAQSWVNENAVIDDKYIVAENVKEFSIEKGAMSAEIDITDVLTERISELDDNVSFMVRQTEGKGGMWLNITDSKPVLELEFAQNPTKYYSDSLSDRLENGIVLYEGYNNAFVNNKLASLSGDAYTCTKTESVYTVPKEFCEEYLGGMDIKSGQEYVSVNDIAEFLGLNVYTDDNRGICVITSSPPSSEDFDDLWSARGGVKRYSIDTTPITTEENAIASDSPNSAFINRNSDEEIKLLGEKFSRLLI